MFNLFGVAMITNTQTAHETLDERAQNGSTIFSRLFGADIIAVQVPPISHSKIARSRKYDFDIVMCVCARARVRLRAQLVRWSQKQCSLDTLSYYNERQVVHR